MCNPRQITINATRDLSEAWAREVTRTVELEERVTGEARVRQHIGESLGTPALRALEAYLANANSGWRQVEGGYRFDVEGGHVTYLVGERVLEIVASLEDSVRASAVERQTLEGHVSGEVAVQAQARYYDDGWGGRTEEVAEREAQQSAERLIEEQRRARIAEAGNLAEQEVNEEIDARARARASERLRETAEERRSELARQARRQLETVGMLARQAYNQAQIAAYRDAILAYARTHQADHIQCTDSGDTVDIEFSLRA